MFELVDNTPSNAVIKVVAFGDSGDHAISYMTEQYSDELCFIYVRTNCTRLFSDSVAYIDVETKNDENLITDFKFNTNEFKKLLSGTDIVFFLVDLCGNEILNPAIPSFAKLANKLGILSIAVVIEPKDLSERSVRLDKTIFYESIEKYVDSRISIPFDMDVFASRTKDKYRLFFGSKVRSFLTAVSSISDLILRPGMINIDFADLQTIMSLKGESRIGLGFSSGADRAFEAAKDAIEHPFLSEAKLSCAEGVLVNITAGLDLTLGQFSEVGDTIERLVSNSATVVIGTVINPELADSIRVTIIATGIHDTINDELSPLNISENDSIKNEKGISLIVQSDTPDKKIAELIEHLSNVYRSVGGDQLDVQSVKTVPPKPSIRLLQNKNKKKKWGIG